MERVPADCLQSTINSLQAVKDAMLESKYLTQNISQQQTACRHEIDRINSVLKSMESSIILNEERIAVLYSNHQGVLNSVRTIQNTVIATVAISIILGISSLAFNSVFNRQVTIPLNTQQGTLK